MIYSGTSFGGFNESLGNYSVIVLLSENYKLLQKETKKVADAIGGPNAESEMRVTRYFNQEISSKRDEIMSLLQTKSFFPGCQLIILNGLPEKNYKVITEIASEWQNGDAITIVTMDGLSKNSELKKVLQSNTTIALVNYSKNSLNSDFLKNIPISKYEHFKDFIDVFVLKEDGNFVSGIIALKFNNSVGHWIGGTNPGISAKDPISFLHWKIIENLKSRKIKSYDLFGANTEHLCNNKSKLNPELKMYFTLKSGSFLGNLGSKIYGKYKRKG